MDELEKLFNVLTRDGYYTKSFEEFQSQYNDPAYRDKVFGVVTRDGLYTNSREEFDVKYSPSGAVVEETITEDPLKKKEDTESVSADGLSESPKTEVVSEQVEVKEDIKPSVFKPKTGFAKQISEDNLFDFSGKGILEKKSPSFTIEEAASRIEMTPEQRREESIEEDLEILFPKGVPEYITQSKIDAEDEEIKRKLNLLDTYNAAIIQQGGEPMSTSEYISTGIYGDVMVDEYGFEKIEDLRSPSKKTIIEQVVKSEILSPDYPLRSEEDISTVKKKITPVSSEKKQEFIDNIISIDKTMLGDYNVNTITGEVINQSEYDFTEVLDEDSYNERKNEIEKNKLNNAFVKNYIPRELYEANKYKSLAPTDFALLNIRAIDNFKNEFGEQEWIEYQNITGNKNPSLVGTKYENESAADSKIQDLVVIGDEDSTVANLSREFPSFDFEVSKAVTAGVEHDKYGDYITISTKDNQGRVVNALEIYLKENNNPVDRIRDFMSGSLLSKKDKSFIDKADNYYKEIDGIVGRSTQSIGQYEKENFGKDPVKELEIYNFLVSNPKKFGDADSPAMYGKDRSIGVVDVDHINFFLDKNKGNISQETIDMIRKKMSMTEGVYSKELAQQGSWASAINTGFAKFIYGFSEGGTGALMSLPSPILSNEEKKEIKNSALEAIEIAKERFTGTTPESMAVRPMSQKAADAIADMIPSIIFGGQVSKGLGLAGEVVGIGKKAKQLLATGSGFAPQTYGAISQELKDVDIPEYQKGLLALPITLVEQMLEGISGINILNKGNFPIFMNVAIRTLKDLPKDASEKTIKAAIRNNLKARLVSLGGEFATMSITEGATEGTQTISEDLFKRIYNEFYSMDVFKVSDLSTKEGMQSYIDAVYESVALGMISGPIGGGGFRAVGSLQKGFKTKQDNKQFKFLYEDLMNDKDLTKRRVSLRLDLETGNITQKRYNESLDILNNGKGIMSQIPEDLSTNKKRESFILLREKQQIEKKIAGKNKELESENIKRIKEIDFLLNSIGQSRKSKTETDAAPVIEESPIKESPVDAPVAEETTVTEEVTEEAPVTEEERTAMREALETQPITKITTDLVAKEKKGELTQEETDGVLLGIMEKIEAENAKRKSPLSPEQAQKKLGKMQQRVFEGNKQRYLELSGVMPAAQEQVVEEAPVVKEEVKVSEEVTAPIAKPKVVVSGTVDGYQVVSSSNTTQAENESVKDARGDKTFDKDGFRITKLKDGSSQASYKSKVKVSDKGNRPGYAMATVTIPKGSPINKQQIQEAFDNKLSEIIESNRKKKLGSKFSDLTAKQSQQLTDAVVNALSQEQVVEEAPIKEAPKRKTRKKKDVSLQQDEIQDKRRTTRRAKRKSESTRASSTRDVKGKPRYDVRESNRVVRDDTVVNTISLSENEAQDLSDNTKGRAVIDTEFYETNDAKLFHKSITESTKNNKYAASVFVYPVSDYKNSRLFLTADGKAGLAITEDGDIISVFSYGEGKGRIPQLIVTAIKEGAVSLDHYDTVLTKYYAKFGFVPAAKVTWNDEFAPDGWSKETFRDFNNGEPDVVAMVYDGGNRETITERVGTFEDVTPKLEEAPYVTEWDDAKKLQDKKKKPKKQEAKISEEVQKEIKRAEGTRDSIVGPLKTKLDRTRGFEQKEEIRDEIRQANKRYNNIITELKEGKRAQFQVKETQETKTDASRYQEFIFVLKRSFPSVEVVTTQAEFDTLLKETGANELITKDQSVYGAVYQGKLYLNPSLENYNTPIHEFGHVWMNVAKEANPKLYDKGIGLVKGSEYEQQIKNNPAYKDSTEQEVLEEALATAIGDKGESFVSASQKKSFKDWLSTLYGFVKKLTGISKYTSEQLEDITLDEFTQAVAVDLLSGRQLFEGAEITDMGDALQLMAEKGVDLDAAMNESINQMIDKGFKAAEIKGVLQQMGYKARAINDALVVKIDADMKLPNEFANIDGGVREGETMFRSVMQKLKEFAAPKLVKRSIKEQYKEAKKDGYEGTIKEYTEEQNNKKVEVLKQANPLLTLLTNEEILERYPNIQNEVVEKQQKSRAEIRAKAIELLEAEPAFKSQDALMQKELVVSMDRTMKTRSNKEVQKRISAIKQTLKGVREGVKDLQAAKKRIKNFINEELLPSGVSVREANKLVRIVEKATKETYESSVAEVMKVVEAQTSKKKKETINKMLKLAQQKSKVTNKRARTDTDARRFFEQAVVVLKALDSKDTKSLEDMQSKLIENEEKIYEILDALNDGLEVNETDRNLSALAQAFDILGSLNNQDLSQHEDALNLMKSELESGMESLRTRRAARKAVYDKLREEANKNIKEGYEFLFDENGQPLETAELDNLSDELKQEMWNNITSIPELLSAVNKFTKLQAQKYGKFSMFFDSVKNLGTLLRGLDRKGKFFEKNVFDKLNNMEEEYLQGYFNTMDMLESELDAIGIKGGIDGLNKIINKEFVIAKTIDLKDIKLSLKKSARPVIKLTRGEAMRVYALSKNATQMSRLKDQGFTPAKMQQIEEFIGPQLVEATDVIVDFLSSSYYESINKVYEDVNDISLPYIENYFPTKTSPSKGSTAAEFDRLSKEINSGNFAGVFSAQQASALKERSSKDAIDIRYKDFSSVIEDHLRTMERFKAYAMGTKEINIIVNYTTSVKTLLAATRLNKTIENSIMSAINPDAVQQLFESSKGGKAFTFFQRQFTGITLALKPIQALKQMTSFINAWEDYSLRGQEKRIPVVDTVLDALGFSYDIAATFILLPKVWGKYSTYNKAMYSASFKDRVRQSFKTADLLGLEQGVGARRRSKKTRLGRAVRKAKVVSNSPTLVGDIAGVMGYMAAYRANMRNGMSQKEAIEMFNKYNETQQTRRGTDKVGLQANGSMYTRVFTMFGSSLFLQLNKVMQSVTKFRRGSIDSFKSAAKGDWKGTKENFPKEKDIRALYVNLAVANVLFAMMSNIFKYNPFMDDDDEELTEEEMERIKKAQNALKRGKEVSDEDMKLMERYQLKLDKEDVLKAYDNAKYGMNQLFNLPLVGPSLQQNWDYYYWNNPNAFSTDKRSRAVNPLEQTFSRNFWDRTLNDVSESESILKTIINFSLGVDVKRPLAMVEALQSYWGDDEMYREGYEELNDDGERKFKGTFEEYKAKQMEENMYELLGISYSYRPGSGKDWTKKKITITIDPKKEEESSGRRKRGSNNKKRKGRRKN